MDIAKFDRENLELIANGQVDKVEARLLDNYEAVKKARDRARLLHAISSLAHFYALPFKEDLTKAERYFRERLETFPDANSGSELVLFCFYNLNDPRKTLKEVARLRSLVDPGNPADVRPLYTGIAVEGQANLALDHIQNAGGNLAQLLDLAKTRPKQVPFGDELNFLKGMLERDLFVDECQSLLEIAVRHVRSVEYKAEMSRLRDERSNRGPESSAGENMDR